MKERPIIFNAEMVRAILDGRKTQTRRIVKPQPPSKEWEFSTLIESTSKNRRKHEGKHHWILKENEYSIKDSDERFFLCPYGYVGDRLWVKQKKLMSIDPDRYRPSIHMPKSEAQIWLEITNVRVERLQDISDEDAKAEGIEGRYINTGIKSCSEMVYPAFPEKDGGFHTPKAAFQALWEKIYSIDAWENNPWVWVIEFKKI